MHKGLTSQEWATFEQLPGAATDNFESLWRALVRGCYGGVGRFVQYKNHPGVEFLIRLSASSSELGDDGTVVGWQCKYFQTLRTGRALTLTQRHEIERSLQETRDKSPEISVWILCVPAKLPKRDVDWLLGKSTESFRVECWDDGDIAEKIDQASNGALIRAAYFGHLAFTADDLLYASRVAYEPIKSRWLKDVHFCTDAEREIRRLLFEPEVRNDFAEAVANLSEMKPYFRGDGDSIRSELLQLIEGIECTANDLVTSFTKGEWFDGRELHEKVVCAARRLRVATIQLKRERDPLAIVTQNALYFVRQIDKIASGIIRDVEVPSVAVVADAGCGKTHMSIALIENGSVHRSGGVLMLAKELSREAGIESLIAKIYLRSGYKIQSVVELLVALNEYGERNKCRVPWVIDGLNESQDPSQWKEILSRISLLIKNDYPRVLLVVTLRTGQCSTGEYYNHQNWVSDDQLYAYKKACLPDDFRCIVGRVPDGNQLIRVYFEYYKIQYYGDLPRMLLHPLSLRLYCQLTNKDRKKEVSPQSLPYDISDIFNAYCDEIAKHISESKAITNRKRAIDYRRNIQDLGRCVWDACDRAMPIEELYAVFPKVEGGWESEWENVLSHEGLILVRPDWSDKRKKVFEIAFDALGGYLVADWLLSQPREWLCELLKSQEFVERIAKRKHPLGEDILSFMVWLFPRINYGDSFYNIVTGEVRDAALRKTIDIDGKYINSKIRADFVRQCRVDESFAESCYYRIFSRSFVTDHPIDSTFLEDALTPFAVAARDTSWGRWVYRNRKGIFGRLSHVLERVQYVSRDAVRQLFFVLKWLLVSNVCSIRDRATHIIVEIGERFPDDILKMISDAFACNDPYVVERLSAAGYGIFMRLYSKRRDKELAEIGVEYVRYLIGHVLGEQAEFPTANQLAIDAMINSIALLQEVQGNIPDTIANFKIPYLVSRHKFRKPEDVDSKACAYVDQAIHMDFANYTLTRLVGTHPYETSGRRYKNIYAQIEQRMYDLGFRCDNFKDEDFAISQNRYRPAFDRDKLSVERFGKKYAWIAFREMESVVREKVYAHNRTSEIDLDPSFPGAPNAFPICFDDNIFSKTLNVEDWIENGILPTYDELRECKLKGCGDDDWVMIFGAIDRESDDKIKNCVTLIKGFFVKKGTMGAVSEYPRQIEELDAAHKSYAYVGESPWSKQLRYCEDDPRRSLKAPKPDRRQFLVGSDEKWDYYLWCDCPYEFFNSEAHSSDENKGATGYLLSHYVLQKLHMRIDPVSWNAVDQEGRIGAVYFKDGESYNTERSFLYIRKDLLCKYMKAEGVDFGWRLFGERRMHYNETPKHEEFLRKLRWEKTCVNLIQQYNPNSADAQGRIKVLRDLNCKEDEGI